MKLKVPRHLLSKVYVLWIFSWTWITGFVSLFFNRVCFHGLLTIGPGASAWGKLNIKIVGNGRIVIGERAHLVSDPNRSFIALYGRVQLTAYGSGRIIIGNGVALNGTAITSKKQIVIGDGTMVAPNVIIVDSDFHTKWPPESRWISPTAEFDQEVLIGRNVWIGMNSLILKGAVIGDNSIIGAGSVVTGTIPPNCIAAGNPAQPVKYLVRPDPSSDPPEMGLD